jgi:Mg-chelatase subunit ChlD
VPESYFTRDMSLFKSELSKLVGSGGGDTAEDIAGALKVASNTLQWQGAARFLLLITDAPTHGTAFSAGYSDTYHNQEQRSRDDFAQAFSTLIANDVCVMHCTCDAAATAKTHEGMKAAADTARNALVQTDGDTATVQHNTSRYLTSVNMCSMTGQHTAASRSSHIVFVLDESGSMEGRPWTELGNAYAQFLNRRDTDQGCGDIVSVIQFTGGTRVTVERQPLVTAPRQLVQRSGGTQFAPALTAAEAVLCDPHVPHGMHSVLVFMSDGQANDSAQAAATITALRQRRIPALKTEVIAFGRSNMQCLQQLATAGGCTVRTALDGAALARQFVAIASGMSAGAELFREIGARISEHVADKLVQDHL